MRLVRYGQHGAERPGMIDAQGVLRDLSSQIPDIDATTVHPDVLARLKTLDPKTLPEIGGEPRLGACINPKTVGKCICIGLNYADHAKETGAPIPAEPIVFMKATSSIIGPNDPVQIPKRSEKCDWEVELAFIMGARASYVDEGAAMAHVAGFAVMNDLSERHFQLTGTGQWTKGKSCDTFGPLGPWLVTPDEVGDFDNLGMWCDIDGVRRQDGTTSTMIFRVPFLIHYLSQITSLEPGDVVTTGTPPGVGMGLKPPAFLKGGETMVTGIDKLGEQRAIVKPASEAG